MSEKHQERDYVLGTHDEELERLALQHRVWRGRALDAWRRAGFTVGQTILDVGCGPGYASLDLAEIVGPSGRVIAMDRSRRFLSALEAFGRQRGLSNLTAHELDLDDDPLPKVRANGAWARWAFAFMKHPRDVLSRVASALAPGAALVSHEYVHYTTWRLTPRNADFESFVQTVVDSWRASGGEPDIGLDLPRWLEELGFEIQTLTTHLDVITPSNFMWQWPRAFVDVGVRRLVELGELSAERAKAITQAFANAEATPGTRLVNPAVLEIIAVKRG